MSSLTATSPLAARASRSVSSKTAGSPRSVKKRVYRDYPREVHYREPRRSRGRQILKKGIKVGIGVGIGVGVGYGIAKALGRRRY